MMPNNALPKGWRRVAIKDMADSIQYGLTASAAERKEGPRFLRITDIQDGRVDWSTVPSCDIAKEQIPKYRLSSGDLVFARTGATTGKSFLIGECPEAVFASYLIRVRVSADVDSRYLSAFFQSPDYWRQIEGGKRGIGQPNVNGSVLGEVQFPVAPLPEQRLIVAEIEKQFARLEAGVAALRRVQANLKRYRAAVLTAACEGCLVPTESELAKTGHRKSKFETGEGLLAHILVNRRQKWKGRGKYNEPNAPDTTNLPKLPEGWKWATVAQLSFLDIGFAFKSAEFAKSGVRLLRGENLEPGKMRWSDTRYWPDSKLDEFRQLLIREGEIVLAMDRPLVSSGLKIARARPDDLPCLLVQRMARFRPINEEMTSFMFTALNTHGFIKHLLGGQTGTQLPHISGDGIQSFPIALPPLTEQKRIVAEVERRLSVVEEMEAVVSSNLQRATRLRQSILQKAFTGNLI
jgi:type I restriction enzyme, S subunit